MLPIGDDLHPTCLRILAQHLQARPEGIRLSSGELSHLYLDCTTLLLDYGFRFGCGVLADDAMTADEVEFDAFAGVPMGGFLLADGAAMGVGGAESGAIIARPDPKRHGLAPKLAAKSVVLCEDVITTGATAQRAAELLIAQGLEVKRIVTLVDREQGGREVLEAIAPVTVLYSWSEILHAREELD